MQTIKVSVSDLRRTLETNRAEHKDDYAKAMVGYREALVKELGKKLKDAKAGKPVPRSLEVVVPVSFEDEYDKIIAKLEWTVDTEVDLEDHEFQQYVLDKWTWRQAFVGSTQSYLGPK